MKKKKIIYIIIFIIIALIGEIYFMKRNSVNNNSNVVNNNDSTGSTGSKILVVYYSASGNTKKVAKEIANNLSADIFEVVPKDVYTSDDLNWNDNNSRVSREHNDESLRDIELTTTKVEGFDSYDTVLIGYPIWWGIAAWPIDNFVKKNDFTDKTVIPFCTAASTDIGQSGSLLEEMTKTGNWKTGIRFYENSSSTNIKSWTDNLK